MRIVIDTNVLVSFLFWKQSPVRDAVEQAFRHVEVLRSTDTFIELAEVISRPKFDKYLSRTERELFLAFFNDNTTYILVEERINACRDPKDDKFLELAVSGKAGIILTGDTDLLALDPFNDVRILEPAAFKLSLKRHVDD